MSNIQLTKESKIELTDKIQAYFNKELDYELGQFDADFLIDFISKEFGTIYYNQGLYDAQAILQNKIDDVIYAISEIEK